MSPRTPACAKGHIRTPENTRTTPQGKKVCLVCERARDRRRYRISRGLDANPSVPCRRVSTPTDAAHYWTPSAFPGGASTIAEVLSAWED